MNNEQPSKYDIIVGMLQLYDLLINIGQTSNDVLLQQLQHQDKDFFSVIVKQNEEIIRQNKTIISELDKLNK